MNDDEMIPTTPKLNLFIVLGIPAVILIAFVSLYFALA